MKSTTTFSLVFGVVLVAFISQSLGHSYLTNPISRSNQKQSNTGCRGPNCLGPCDRPLSAATLSPIAIQRGASISVEWPRNNHAGGFIRLAWAPTGSSDSHSAFDAGVQQISCHEVGGCKPDNVNDPDGGDSAPADGSFQPCKLTINVPQHLTNGAWTLQWVWYGGGYFLGDYYSCVDYVITGGPSNAVAAAPVFIGGDFSYPNQQKCRYFNTDRPHRCVNEPCDNPVYPPGARSGMPFMGATPNIPSTPVPVPVPVPASPLTTSARAATTRAATTAATPVVAATTGRTVSVQPAIGNCAGFTQMSISTAQLISVDAWRNSFLALVKITVMESTLPNWRLQVIFPATSINAQVNGVYNAGKLACSSANPVRHAVIEPAGSWAKNLVQGQTLEVEIEVNNAGILSSEYIQQNLQLKLYKS